MDITQVSIIHHIAVVLLLLWGFTSIGFSHPVVFFISLVYLYKSPEEQLSCGIVEWYSVIVVKGAQRGKNRHVEVNCLFDRIVHDVLSHGGWWTAMLEKMTSLE